MGEEVSRYGGIVWVSVTVAHRKFGPTLQMEPFAIAHFAVTAFSGAKDQNLGGAAGGSWTPAPSHYKQP
jgi:hypothetical protein